MTFGAWVQESPLGPLSVTTSGAGLRRIDLGLAGAGAGPAGGGVDRGVADALDAYFAGDLEAVDALPVDLEGRSPFATRVLVALRAVGPGELTTYGRLAQVAGHAGAARAVGRAMAANPLPIVIPCHRVVAGDGSIGGYSGGLEVKRWLLGHEGHARHR